MQVKLIKSDWQVWYVIRALSLQPGSLTLIVSAESMQTG